MAEPNVAIQNIVFGERNRTDFAGVLRDVKAAGFTAVEGGNFFAAYGEAETRKQIEAAGVAVSGCHCGYGDFADEAKVAANVAYLKAMGVKHLICSGVADISTVDGYRKSCAVFNEVGKLCAGEGLVFNYHNHAFEFDKLEGGSTIGMDILAAETDPAVVKFNIDVFWVTIGGADPAAFIRQHAARAGYFHFKDGRKLENGLEFLELGTGVVDLKGSIAAAREVGATWIVAEQDQTKLPHLESATISRTYLRDVLGV